MSQDDQAQIKEKAKTFAKKVEERNGAIIVTGPKTKIDAFIAFVNQIDTDDIQAFYPRFWDHNEKQKLAIIPTSPESLEYLLACEPFLQNPNIEVEGISRVQNKYLMETYINMIRSKRGSRSDQCIKNRKNLIYGNFNVNIEKVCSSNDTGIDIQGAINGQYGRGLYFYSSIDACLKTIPNNGGLYKVIIADVFIGNVYSSPPNQFIKAPDSYDSVMPQDNQDIYVTYEAFSSYPLYVVEFRIQK